MFLLNITNIIDHPFVPRHLEWLRQIYIPLIQMKCNFQDIKLFKIVDSPNEGFSVSIQLITSNLEEIELFKQHIYPVLQDKMQNELQGHLFIFDSVLEVMEL